MRTLVVAMCLTGVVSLPLHSQCSDAERKRLEEVDRAWGDATQRGDRAALESIIATDFVGAAPTGTVSRASTIDGAVQAAAATRASPAAAPRLTYDHYVITCTPNTGTVTHRNVVTTNVDGRERTSYSRSVHTFERRGGRWQVVGNAGHTLDDSFTVLYLENDWSRAIRNHDAAWVERNFAADATDISDGTVRNKAQAIEAMRNDRSVVESDEMSEVGVRVDGNAAVVTGIYRIRGRDASGKPFDHRHRFTDTWIKRDGRWLMWASQGATLPPVSP
jgi:ketosteroid isomerase-like protein